MNISADGLKFIETNEGFKLDAYQDVAGIWTIGVGHTGPEVREGLKWTLEQVEDQLEKDVSKVEMTLNALIPDNCTQNQFDALVDFGFNCGTGALQTLLSHGWEAVPFQIPRWTRAAGNVSPGLLARRKREIALFNS